jgi:hypothetical protein
MLDLEYYQIQNYNIYHLLHLIYLATSLSSINSAITALQAYDTSQTILNTGYASDITTLYSDKQNVLSDSNKLNPAYINAGTGTLSSTKMQYLSSIGGDITNALNSKQDVLSNVSFLDATSSVQTQLNLKQGIITDGSLTRCIIKCVIFRCYF